MGSSRGVARFTPVPHTLGVRNNALTASLPRALGAKEEESCVKCRRIDCRAPGATAASMLPGGHQPRVTRLSKAITGLLVLVFLIEYFVPSTSAYIALVPGRTLPCVWNLVTAGFLTNNIVTLGVDVAALILLARLVEPVYGSREFLKFIFIVDFAACFCVFVCVYITYAYTMSGKLLYTEFHGFHGIAAGLLVAMKQILGDQEAKVFGVVKISIKYIPLTILALATVVAVLLQQYEVLGFLYFGFYSAWLYLRYFQHQQDTGAQGDASESFKFSGFFPPFMAPVIDPVAAVLAFVFRMKHAPAPAAQVLQANAGASMLGSDAADANRRRERGAKALEERLGMKRQQEGDVEDGAVPPQPQPSVTASSYFKPS